MERGRGIKRTSVKKNLQQHLLLLFKKFEAKMRNHLHLLTGVVDVCDHLLHFLGFLLLLNVYLCPHVYLSTHVKSKSLLKECVHVYVFPVFLLDLAALPASSAVHIPAVPPGKVGQPCWVCPHWPWGTSTP